MTGRSTWAQERRALQMQESTSHIMQPTRTQNMDLPQVLRVCPLNYNIPTQTSNTVCEDNNSVILLNEDEDHDSVMLIDEVAGDTYYNPIVLD